MSPVEIRWAFLEAEHGDQGDLSGVYTLVLTMTAVGSCDGHTGEVR